MWRPKTARFHLAFINCCVNGTCAFWVHVVATVQTSTTLAQKFHLMKVSTRRYLSCVQRSKKASETVNINIRTQTAHRKYCKTSCSPWSKLATNVVRHKDVSCVVNPNRKAQCINKYETTIGRPTKYRWVRPHLGLDP